MNGPENVSPADIVQAIPDVSHWAPALVVVTEVKSWGVQGYTAIPTQGLAFIRLRWEEFVTTGGKAVYVRKGEEEDV